MGVITISMSDEDELALRSLAESKFGKTKGAISKTVVESIKEDAEKERLEKRWEKLMDSWEKYPLNEGGEKPYESRNELYDRY